MDLGACGRTEEERDNPLNRAGQRTYQTVLEMNRFAS